MKKGSIILIPFPFTDLTGSKIRPAVVLNKIELDDLNSVKFISSIVRKLKK